MPVRRSPVSGVEGLAERIGRAGHQLVVPEAAPTSEAEVAHWLVEADAAIAGAREPYNAATLAQAKRLRVISRVGVGYDNVDVEAATQRGVALALTPGTIEESVADLALALLLACARGLPAMNAGVHAGPWPRILGMELDGKCLGILGLGRIGRAVARRAQAFGMRVVAYDPAADAAYAAAHAITLLPSTEAVLAEADVVSLHLPMQPHLRGFVGREFLARMRPGSILINTARGPLVDEAALAEALRSGHLRAAGLDVLAQEPVAADNPLRGLSNVVLTPHVASYTHEAWTRMVTRAVDNALAVLAGGRPPGLLNPEALDRGR
jgi:phosphoglycerate dehydrogenase-like enzyme